MLIVEVYSFLMFLVCGVFLVFLVVLICVFCYLYVISTFFPSQFVVSLFCATLECFKISDFKNMQFFIILSICESWITQKFFQKFFSQLDSSHQYNCFEVQHP